MARIRTIKPEFWDSPSTAKASLHARLLYIAMWNWADDWGIGDANPRRLLGFAFPSDGDSAVEPRNFRHLAGEVSACFGVKWYESDGREFYEIQNWGDHQRTEKRSTRRNPPSDQAERMLYTSTSESPRLNRGSSEDGTGEQGNRGTGEETPCASAGAERGSVDGDFDDWYQHYPRKKARGNALKAYRAARKKASHDDLVSGLLGQLPSLRKRETEKIPYPATWLNGESWNDEPDNVTQLRPDGQEMLLPPLPARTPWGDR